MKSRTASAVMTHVANHLFLRSVPSDGCFGLTQETSYIYLTGYVLGHKQAPVSLLQDNGIAKSEGAPPRLNPDAFILKRVSNLLKNPDR